MSTGNVTFWIAYAFMAFYTFGFLMERAKDEADDSLLIAVLVSGVLALLWPVTTAIGVGATMGKRK